MYSSIQEVISLTEVQVVSDLPLFLIMYFNLKYLPMWLICLCGVISHVLLSFAFFRDPLKCFRNSPTYLVANLAASHFIICLFGPFVVVSIHWSLNIIWKCTTAASIVTICSIAADRYLMVAFPFKHHSLMRGKKIILWIIFIWVLSSSSSFEILLDPQSSVLVIHSINLYIALIIMFGAGLLYVLTFLSLRKQARNLGLHNPAGESNANSTQRVRQLREKRFLNTIVLVACIEVIGIAPCLILYERLVAKGIYFQRSIPIDILWCFLYTLYYFTHAINPCLYVIRLPNYRKTFFALYWKCELHH